MSRQESFQRLWGIDLIAGLYALTALVIGLRAWLGAPDQRTILGLVLVPMCLLLSLGIELRINGVRKLVVVLLCLSLVVDLLLLIFYVGALWDLIHLPPDKVPFNEICRISLKVGVVCAILDYFQRPDVLAAFGHESEEEDYQEENDGPESRG